MASHSNHISCIGNLTRLNAFSIQNSASCLRDSDANKIFFSLILTNLDQLNQNLQKKKISGGGCIVKT